MRRLGPKTTAAAWLIGTWRSDKKRTLAEYRWPARNPTKLKRVLSRDLGKLTFRYTARRIYGRFEKPEWEYACPYRIIWRSKDEVFIVRGPKGDEEGQLISFVSPTVYRVPMGKGGVEYFTKLRDT